MSLLLIINEFKYSNHLAEQCEWKPVYSSKKDIFHIFERL